MVIVHLTDRLRVVLNERHQLGPKVTVERAEKDALDRESWRADDLGGPALEIVRLLVERLAESVAVSEAVAGMLERMTSHGGPELSENETFELKGAATVLRGGAELRDYRSATVEHLLARLDAAAVQR